MLSSSGCRLDEWFVVLPWRKRANTRAARADAETDLEIKEIKLGYLPDRDAGD